MSTTESQEIWQVEVGGQIYEAPFGELGDWIGEGSLQPADKVRKGNLRWIEARRVPSLVPFFNAKEQGLSMPVLLNTTDVGSTPETPEPTVAADNFQPQALQTSPPVAVIPPEPIEHSIAVAPPSQSTVNPDFCAIHNDVPTVFLCDGCANGFCKVCPKAYGGSVRICPFCGALCKLLKEVAHKREQTQRRAVAMDKGFGAEDFFSALAFPLKFKASLFFGAVMFAFFSVGQSVTALGGMYMIVSAIFCIMLANMLTFGVLANTIDNFAHGHLETNLMPSFEDFELWDDVIHPFFLSIGAYVASFGPFFLVLIIGFYVVVSSVQSEMQTFQQNVEKIPGTHYYDAQRTLDQSETVKDVLGNTTQKHNERLAEYDAAARGETVGEDVEEESVSARETREQEELWEMAQQSRKQGLESVIGKSPETQAKENEAMLQSFLGLAAPLVVIGAIFFLWGLFYFPAACAVAGYTRSFTATINPIIGLDTIKRLGGTYVKILMMGLVLLVASAFVGGVLGLILSPFNLPGMGNIPAKFIGALFSFYLFTVFACVLGYALYKKSDKLAIQA